MTTPTHIGPYQIIRELGRGGMGVVYLAQDPAVNRQLALKLLPADLATDEGSRRRFEQEVAVFARLEHPHIVPTYGVGLSGRTPWLAMRYLAGGTLDHVLDDDAFTDAGLWRAMHQVARALDYAHNEDLVHRDIKPSNILFDDAHNAFVADFGIARVVNAAAGPATATSVTGTPTYMSPEQFRKESVDGRSDQYSLAVVLYEALAGRPPFSGDTLQMMYQHVYEHPPTAHTIEEALPVALSPVLARALAKKPEERYPTVEAFISAAERAATDPFALPVAPIRQPAPAPPGKAALAAAVRQPAAPAAPPPQLISAAGAAPPAARGKRPLIAGLAVLALVALAAWLLLRPQDTNATRTEATPAAAATAAAATTPDAAAPAETRRVTVLAPSRGSIRHNEAGGGQLNEGDVLEFSGQAPLSLIAGGDKLALALDDGTRLDIASGSELALTLAETDGGSMARVIVTHGVVLAATGMAEPFGELRAPRAAGIEIANRPGARAILHSGMMGVTGTMTPLRFEVDCLEGSCTVFGDLGGETALIGGQRSVVGGSGLPSAAAPARYELFAALADFVPTPTATAAATTTATRTRTPRPTRTPRNTPVPATATRPRAIGPAATMTPTRAAAPDLRPEETDTPRPNATATSRPSLPTATTTPQPYQPPATATSQPYPLPTPTLQPYQPPVTPTPQPYVPPTSEPWPTETPEFYP